VFEQFTESALEVVVRAEDEARTARHTAVESEHVLLGLFGDQDGIAGRVFAAVRITIEPARDLVRKRLGTGPRSSPDGPIPFSPDARRVFGLASRLALAMGEPVDTQHILLAITRLSDCGAYRVLRALDVDPGVVRFEIKQRSWPAPDRGTGPSAPEVRHVRSAPLRR